MVFLELLHRFDRGGSVKARIAARGEIPQRNQALLQVRYVLNELREFLRSVIAVATRQEICLRLVAHEQLIGTLADDAVPVMIVFKVLHLKEANRRLGSWAILRGIAALRFGHIAEFDQALLNIRHQRAGRAGLADAVRQRRQFGRRGDRLGWRGRVRRRDGRRRRNIRNRELTVVLRGGPLALRQQQRKEDDGDKRHSKRSANDDERLGGHLREI